MKRHIVVMLWIAFVVLTLMKAIGMHVPGLDAMIYLPFAWIWFIARIGPQLHFRWDLIVSAIVYAFVLTLGSHLFLRWLHRELHGAAHQTSATGNSWRWRWTLSGFAMIVLMFAAGIAIAGVVHQVTWLSRSSEPMYRKRNVQANRVKCASNLRQIGLGLLMYANDHKNQFPEDLGPLLIEEDLLPDFFICPSSDDTRADGPTTQAAAGELSKPGHCSYIYFGKGRKNDMPSNEPLLLELPSNHDGDGINVCFGDGHVEWLNEPAAGEFLVKHGFERIEAKEPYAK